MPVSRFFPILNKVRAVIPPIASVGHIPVNILCCKSKYFTLVPFKFSASQEPENRLWARKRSSNDGVKSAVSVRGQLPVN
eukprot:3207057-Amphidinium_carterae.1